MVSDLAAFELSSLSVEVQGAWLFVQVDTTDTWGSYFSDFLSYHNTRRFLFKTRKNTADAIERVKRTIYHF